MINTLINIILYLYAPLTLLAMIFYAVVYESKNMTFLKMIVSELPAGQLSEDENFHEYAGGASVRYSIFYFPFATYKIYFLTWTREKKFNLYEIISLQTICNTQIDKKEHKLKEITQKSYQKYAISNEDEKKQHIELLQEQCKDLQDREKVSQFKAGFYLTALALVIAAMADKIGDAHKILDWNLYQQIVFGLITLYVLNVLGLLFGFSSVKSYNSETYSDFRDSSEKEKKYYEYWYMKFQRLQVYTDREVSYIVNIEKFLKLIVIWSVIFTIILMIGGKEECGKNLSCQDMNLSCKITQ